MGKVAAGGVGALSNIAPKVWSKWVKATAEGDKLGMEQGLKRITELFQIYSLESTPHKLIKEILRAEGLEIGTYCHFPYNNLKPDSLEKALELLGEDANWLK